MDELYNAVQLPIRSLQRCDFVVQSIQGAAELT